MRRLAAPLRVTWDWDWPPIVQSGAPLRRWQPELLREVGAELVRARVLLLEVGYPDARALAAGDLARALAGFAGQLSLVLDPAAAAVFRDTPAGERPGAAEVWLDATPLAAGAEAHGPVETVAWPAVRIYLTARNHRAAAAALLAAVGRGATAVSLPNLPLFGEILGAAREVAPAAAHLREFADLVAPLLASHPGVDLRVHHYGLWEILRRRGLHPQGEEAPGHAGCQAGAALAHIDPRGVLYPCASLPIPLERMGAGALTRAWAGEELQSLRAEIDRLPPACRGCPEETSCRGGCRGWAQFLAGNWEETGPDCVRPQ